MLKLIVSAICIGAGTLCHAAAQPGETAQSRFDEGIAAYQAGNTSAATTAFSRACDLGLAAGCFNLGYIYNQEGTASHNASKEAFRKSCEAASGPYYNGCYAYALKLDTYGSDGYAPDEALRYYEISCRSGDIYAACSKAASKLTVRTDEDKQAENYARARVLNQKGCEGNNVDSCWALSNAYFSGRGGEKNYATSLQLIQKACTLDPTYGLDSPFNPQSSCDMRDLRLSEIKQKCSAGETEACSAITGFEADSLQNE